MKIKTFAETVKNNLKSLSKKDIAICAAIGIAVVLLTFGSVGVFNKDKQTQPDNAASASDKSTEFELRLSEILCKIDGAGNVNVLINRRDGTDEIIGAVILFEGEDIPETRIKLQLATQTALGIEASKIKIFTMKT